MKETLEEEPNPFELPKALPDDVFYESLEEPKQETLEEAAETHLNSNAIPNDYQSFIKGAEWQQERMYSEEDVLDVLKNFYRTFDARKNPPETSTIPLWFEQFKKN